MKISIEEAGWRRYIFKAEAFCYFLLLLYLVFFSRRRRRPLPEGEEFNIIPFYKKIHFLMIGHHKPKELLVLGIDILGNILLFIPYPFFLFIFWRSISARRCFLISTCSSILIELLQLGAGIGVADIDDVILNSLGALLGIVICKKLLPGSTV